VANIAASTIAVLLLCSSALAQNMRLLAPDTGWALSGTRLYWTADNGTHWKNITPQSQGAIDDVYFLDASHGWVLFSHGDEDNNEGNNTVSFEVARTIDSGETWAITPIAVPSQEPTELNGRGHINFADPQHGWAVLLANSDAATEWGLLLATDDGGTSWKELPQPPVVGRPVFAAAQNGWISGPAWAGGIYSTRDGGKSWQPDGPSLESLPPSLPTRASYGDVKFTDANHGFVPIWLRASSNVEEPRGTALILYTTEDGGRTWGRDKTLADRGAFSKTGAALSRIGASAVVPDPSGGVSSFLVAFNDRKHLNRVTLMTVGRGETWTDATPAAISENVLWRQGDDVAELSFTNAEQGWARTSLEDLLLTTDGGKTWKNISPVLVTRPTVIPTTNPRKLKARRLGPGPKLVPQSAPAGLHYTARLGFDEHNVASIATMGTWWSMSPFFDAGIYVGGINYCGLKVNGVCKSRPDPGLTATWVSQAQGQGWGFFPIWIGPQAPCVNASGFGTFTAANAAVQGSSNADSAAAAMAALGLPDTVVFYDMENYTDDAQHVCSTAVRAFLTAWVHEMNADGFQTTAVYGNPGPAENDFSQVPGLTQVWISVTPGTNKPPRVTIWGLGSGSYTLSNALWPTNQRAHQFLIDIGSATAGYVAYGGVKTNLAIDYDVENLQIPGADGTKDYIWFASSISIPNGEVNAASGVNDVLSSTNPTFISNGQLGQIVGNWNPTNAATCPVTTDFCFLAFLYQSSKTVTFSAPAGRDYTSISGINNASQISGFYCYGFSGSGNAGSCWDYSKSNVPPSESGFVGSLATNPFTYAPTNYYAQGSGFTFVEGINDDGQAPALGYSSPYDFDSPTPVLYQANGFLPLFTTCEDQQPPVFITGINGFSQMVGVYAIDPRYSAVYGNSLAFLYDYENDTGIGTCITLGPLGAVSSFVTGINNQGQIVGIYEDQAFVGHNFLLDNGFYYSFDPPYLNCQDETLPYDGAGCSINDAAQIVTWGGYVYNPE